jgi:hypothetical protein
LNEIVLSIDGKREMTKTTAQMLHELNSSILFAPDFPKRGDKLASLRAIELAHGQFWHLATLVRRLGETGDVHVLPVLIRLWQECALKPVRDAVGDVLFDMRTPKAWGALQATINEGDPLSTFLGIKVVFERDPLKAYDYFAPYFAEARADTTVPSQVLSFFSPCSFSSQGPQWLDNARDWLKQDPRWLELCARLRRDDTFGFQARAVLRYAPAADRATALDRVHQEEAQSAPSAPPRIERIGNLLTRYEQGEFEGAWSEIRSYPHIDGDFRSEILEVAEVTMRRVSRNADMLAERLHNCGWLALTFEGDDLRTKPKPEDENVFCRIEEITASPVPTSLLAFWRIVGGINWIWDYNSDMPLPNLGVDLPMEQMDPLSIVPPQIVTHNFDEWENQKATSEPDWIDPFQIDLAPDYLHKADISGGGPYGVELPFFGADPCFVGERHELPFIDYLRLSFRWAGFPGLEDHADRADVRRFVAEFGKGLEPF